MTKIYIFGYGSFQNFSSIEKSIFAINDDEGDIEFLKKNIINASPLLTEALLYDNKIKIVRVKNIKRGWYFNIGSPDYKITKLWITLGAYKSKKSTCNGTLFPVTPEQLTIIDLRESGYIRTKLDINDITIIKGNEIPKDSIIYYYAIDKKIINNPTKNYPILQSYVDLCMSGCISTDKLLENKNYEFTNEFVNTTKKWNKYKYWINDRIYPRRPFVYIPYAGIIDKILNTQVIL
jgi:hypothetical protein